MDRRIIHVSVDDHDRPDPMIIDRSDEDRATASLRRLAQRADRMTQ